MASTKLREFRKNLIYFLVLFVAASCSESTSQSETTLEKKIFTFLLLNL